MCFLLLLWKDERPVAEILFIDEASVGGDELSIKMSSYLQIFHKFLSNMLYKAKLVKKLALRPAAGTVNFRHNDCS